MASAAESSREWEVRSLFRYGSNSLSSWVCGVVVLGITAAFYYGLAWSSASLAGSLFGVVTLMIVGMALQYWKPNRRLRINRDHVVLDERVVARREQIKTAVAYETPAGVPMISMIGERARGWPFSIDLEVADMPTGRAIARLFTPSGDNFLRTRLPSFRLLAAVSLAFAVATMFVIPGSVYLRLGSFLLAWIQIVGTVAMIVGARWSFGTEYTVGNDGLRIKAFWRERFVPFSDIVRVDRIGFHLFLKLGEKDSVEVSGADLLRLTMLQAKLLEGLDRYRLLAHPLEVPIDLERQDRSAKDWLATLRNVGAWATSDYRAAATSPDYLARLLGDRTAPPASRVASAVALDALDPKAPTRIRVVAAETANPKLRIALERIADHADDAEIGARLDALEDMKR